MLNPVGKLFIERLGHGVCPAGEMSSAAAEMVIGTVAHALQSEVDTEQPIICGETADRRPSFRGPVAAGGREARVHDSRACIASYPAR